jgi:predicted transcriptional regulator/transcriptional regulator with XRE-family HTH domain
MHKTFMGVRLKALREQRGLTQAALAEALKLSPSYLNQIENNQRPLTVPVLLRLQAAFGVDLQLFSEDDQARLIADLREATVDVAGADAVPMAEVRAVAQQTPAVARALLTLHKRYRAAEERLAALAAGSDGDRFTEDVSAPAQPYEEVREFFYARHDHMAMLDERGEQLYERLMAEQQRGTPGDLHEGHLAPVLEQYLLRHHGIRTRRVPDQRPDQPLRVYDPTQRVLTLSQWLDPGQRAFQIGIQIALLEQGELIDSFCRADAFTTGEARTLARIGFANHFAGALVLPCRRFQAAAEELRYDIDLLAQRFGVSFETVCHRLSTMQRLDANSIPFFFVRVDRAGNVSKRQSSVDFHFSRTGGTCPLWNVYEAFSHPDRVITQLSRMPDGRTYLWVARTVTHQRGGYGTQRREFAVALGCDVRHADRLVYAKGLDLKDPEAATPIGAGCKVCDREHCAQRAFPALGRQLDIDENVRKFGPYSAARETVG